MLIVYIMALVRRPFYANKGKKRGKIKGTKKCSSRDSAIERLGLAAAFLLH